MTRDPIVSIIMSTRNNVETLPKALEPFLRDRSGLEPEIVLVNDGSTDGTREYLDVLAAEIPGRLRILHLEQSIGLTKALNLAIRNAGGEYLARQDADDVSHPDRLGKQLARFREKPLLDVLGTGNRIVDPDGNPIVSIRGQNFGNLEKILLKRNVFCHGSLMVRKASMERLGGYDEFFRFSQDYDLILRAVKAGLRLENLTECLYDWTFSDKSITSSQAREQSAFARLARKRFADPEQSLLRGWDEIEPAKGQGGVSREHQLMEFYLLGGETGKALKQLSILRKRNAALDRPYVWLLKCILPKPISRFSRYLVNLRYR